MVNVLLVEDNRGDVLLLQEALAYAKLNYHLTVAADGEEAMTQIKKEGGYSLILLDLNLPRKPGREVLAELQAQPELLSSIPLVILTSSEADRDLMLSYPALVREYLIKPITFAGYIEVVNKIDEIRKSSAA